MTASSASPSTIAPTSLPTEQPTATPSNASLSTIAPTASSTEQPIVTPSYASPSMIAPTAEHAAARLLPSQQPQQPLKRSSLTVIQDGNKSTMKESNSSEILFIIYISIQNTFNLVKH
mmetsp:Transcript_18343/g.26450  ORF Transcript_18343/g.26450 Transcript_18343/m.26450 type:complete len:118 (-) Transcript_18343:17-370(-)